MVSFVRGRLNHKKLTAKVKPSHVTSSQVQQSSGANISLSIAAGIQNLDLGIVAVATIATATITAPSGWAKIRDISPDAGVRLHLYVKYLSTADSSTNAVFTTSNSGESVCAVMGVYRGVGGWSIFPQSYVSNSTEALNNRPRRICSLDSGPDDMVVAVCGTYSYSTLGADSPAITNPPTGYTLRRSPRAANNALVFGRAAALMDSTSQGNRTETYTTTNNVHNCSFAMALSPVAPRSVEIDRLPNSLTGLPINIIGTSSSAYVPRTEVNYGYCTRAPWGVRMQIAQGGGGVNYSMPGARAADIASYIFGTRVMTTESVNLDPLAVNRAGTWDPSRKGLVLTDLIGNDIINQPDVSQSLTGARVASDAILSLLTCSGAQPSTAISASSLGWGAVSSDGLMFGSAVSSSIDGSYVEFQVTTTSTSNTEVHIVTVAGDNASIGNLGAPFEVYVNNVFKLSGTTHNQMKATGFGQNYKFCPMVVKVTGLPVGTNTIRFMHGGNTGDGSVLFFNGYLLRNRDLEVNPIWVTTNTLAEMASATYTSLGFTKAKQDTYSAMLKTLASEYPNVVFYDPSARKRWDIANMFAADGVHQNEAGHAHYARELWRELVFRVN